MSQLYGNHFPPEHLEPVAEPSAPEFSPSVAEVVLQPYKESFHYIYSYNKLG
jgi:hypothetical protein